MNKSFQNDNLEKLFIELKSQQRLVNILFDEVKLKKAMQFSNSHYWASNDPNDLATSAVAIEIVYHIGGPRFILSITPVSSLKSYQLKEMIQEPIHVIHEKVVALL